MKSKIAQYFIIFCTSAILDAIWLGLISRSFYAEHIGFLLNDNPILWIAVFFYAVFALSILVFIITPAFEHNFNLRKVVLYGALLGLTIYGAYDITNQMIIKGWPVVVTIADIAWGVVMTSGTATISYSIIKKLR